jgi:hypothetical protein
MRFTRAIAVGDGGSDVFRATQTVLKPAYIELFHDIPWI